MFFFWNFAELYLRAALANCHETFTHDWKCVHLDNVGPKIRGLPQNNFGGQLVYGRNLRAPSADQCETLPNYVKWVGLISCVQKFGYPLKNCGQQKLKNWCKIQWDLRYQNQKSKWSTTAPHMLGEKIGWTLVRLICQVELLGAEFKPHKLKINCKTEELDTLLKKIRETWSTDHRHESGRPKHVRAYWRERDNCGWTGRPTKPGRPETNTWFNTPDIHKDGSNTTYHCTDHWPRSWS